MRAAALAAAFARRFRTVLVCTGDLTQDLAAPPGVELVAFPHAAHFPHLAQARDVPWGGHLISVLNRVAPVAILLEYFPFGRQLSSIYVVPFLRAARRLTPTPLIVSSVRDIQEQTLADQQRYEKRVVQGVNRLMDAVLVHSDPQMVRLSDTFALAAQLTKPVIHTGYVTRPFPHVPAAPRRRVCLVSAGGGAGGAPLLLAGVRTRTQHLLPEDIGLRIVAGSRLPEPAWRDLEREAEGASNLELIRWVPDLRVEMQRAAVSVSRCGYNTALDIIGTRTPSLVVPFVEKREDEQTFRAAKLEQLGVARVLTEERLTPATLAAGISDTLNFTPRHLELDCRGAERSVEVIEGMLAARQRTVTAAVRASDPQ